MGGIVDQEFARFLLQLGTGGAIAGLLFFFYRKDVRSYTDLWQAQATANANQTAVILKIVQDNTAATVTNTEVLRALHNRIDKLELLKVVAAGEAEDPQRQLPPGRRQ